MRNAITNNYIHRFARWASLLFVMVMFTNIAKAYYWDVQVNNAATGELKITFHYWHGETTYMDDCKIYAYYDDGTQLMILDFDGWDLGNNSKTFYGSSVAEGAEISGSRTKILYWTPKIQSWVEIKMQGWWYWEDGSYAENWESTINYNMPSTPTNISTTNCNGITLSWSGITSHAGGVEYHIYRNGNFYQSTSSTSFSESNFTYGSTYRYKVYSVYLYGSNKDVLSDASEEFTITALRSPAAPTDVVASDNLCDKILLKWSYNKLPGNEVTEFAIGGYKTASGLSASQQSYEFSSSEINDFAYHSFIVTAKNVCGSTSSTSFNGKVFSPPSAPTIINAVPDDLNAEIALSWNDVALEDNFLLNRVSLSTGSEIKMEVAKNLTSYIDNNLTACETYIYTIAAANYCAKDGISNPTVKVESKIIPYIFSAGQNYLTSFEGSKAYYPDKVEVKWAVANNQLALASRFVIQRRQQGATTWESLATVSGAASYDDRTAVSGVFYEYSIQAEADCSSQILYSNILTEYGFRMPYGVVNGHIEYAGDVAVEGVIVTAEKQGQAIGNSLLFNGGSVIAPNKTSLNPANAIVVEAWIRPTTVVGSHSIVYKGNYHLYQSGSDIQFTINGITVTAAAVLTANTWIHVAGMYNGSEVKIFINGKVPFDTSYLLDNDDYTTMQLMEIPIDVIDALNAINGVSYSTDAAFLSAISAQIGDIQKNLYSKFLLPMARIETIKTGATAPALGTIAADNGSLYIGDGAWAFAGNIEEVRIWNIAKTNYEMVRDYMRIVANDTYGMCAYWRMDENFGAMVYDCSKTGPDFNKNHAAFSGNVGFSPLIPDAAQLGWKGVTDSNGDYTIPYIPYYATGENVMISPVFGQHIFSPKSRTVFIGEGANIVNEQNFTDISSFKLTGTVYYENTYCGVEGCTVTVDGKPVIKEGKIVTTDPNGEFTINVPAGYHYVSVTRAGHVYKSYKFPPGPETMLYNFVEPLTGINFIDQTKVRVVGRVAGGTVESDKLPDLGLGVNNIGQATFTFSSVTGPDCAVFNIETDPETGEYSVELPPMKYQVKNFTVPKNPNVDTYFGTLPIADFSGFVLPTVVSYTPTSDVQGKLTIDRTTATATLVILNKETVLDVMLANVGTPNETGRIYYNLDAYEYKLTGSITVVYDKFPATGDSQSTVFHFRNDFIYRTVPQINVTNEDGGTFFGEEKVRYEDRVSRLKKEFDIKTYPFLYPVFTQNNDYRMRITAFEVYYNQDNCAGINGCDEAKKTIVNVSDGNVIIYNQLATIQNTELKLQSGEALYKFTAGKPNVLQNMIIPEHSFTNYMTLVVSVDMYNLPWLPFDEDIKYFRGYILGANPIKGSDFVSEGPAEIISILRDPPGSESTSSITEGTEIVNTRAWSFGGEGGVGVETEFGAGDKRWLPDGSISEQEAHTKIKLSTTVGGSGTNSIEITNAFESTISTSGAPEKVGTPSDVFIGQTQNYTITLADNISIFPFDLAISSGIPTVGALAGATGNKFVIGKNNSFVIDPAGFPTLFVYTQDHIENTLIPQLTKTRNSIFVEQWEKYVSKIPITDSLYGTNNDDPIWTGRATLSTSNYVSTETADYDGASYKFTPAKEGDVDQVRKMNQAIRIWKELLARNESEKYNSKYIKNISFDAGADYEESTSTTVVSSRETEFEFSIEGEIEHSFQSFFKLKAEYTGTLTAKYTEGSSRAYSKGITNTYGFALTDPDDGDYFSVDIRDPQTGTGPVFSTKGGRSMCPFENQQEVTYYHPGNHTINDDVISKLQALNIDAALLRILKWEKTENVNAISLANDLEITTTLDMRTNLDIYKAKTYQIKNRQFATTTDMYNTIVNMIKVGVKCSDIYPATYDMIRTRDWVEERVYIRESDSERMIGLHTQNEADKLLDELTKYWSYIYQLSLKPVKKPNLLSTATIQRENPSISILPNTQFAIPDDNKAYFTLLLGNNSNSGDEMEYQLSLVEESNPDGLVITMDGLSLNRAFTIPYGQTISKTLAVEMGKDDIYDYEGIEIEFGSACDDISQSISFDVHFVPSCSDIEIFKPLQDFVVNYENEKLVDGLRITKVPVILGGYDFEHPTIRNISFEYKFVTEPAWIQGSLFTDNDYPDPTYTPIDGWLQGLEWNLSGFPDGLYQMRARTFCGVNADNYPIFDLSEEWMGMVDRKPPTNFGTPSPADGILQPNDEISLKFSEEIFDTKLNKLANFDIRGVLNGTDIEHSASVGFRASTDDFVRIPEGIVLTDRPFTVEFWTKRMNTNVDECIFSQGTDPLSAINIGFTANNTFFVQLGSQTVETSATPPLNVYTTNNPYTTASWHHWGVVYDPVQKQIKIFIDGQLAQLFNVNSTYAGYGPIVLGKRLHEPFIPYNGNLHELRIWTSTRTQSQLASNMGITLSGKETGLTGYWQLDECKTDIAIDKVRGLNGKVKAQWLTEPTGYAAYFDGTNDYIEAGASTLAFNTEQDFTIEFWFKGDADNDGKKVTFLSNGKGDGTDFTIYMLNATDLFYLERTLPLSTTVKDLKNIENQIYTNEVGFLVACGIYMGTEASKYSEQLIRFGKKPTTYWNIGSDEAGNMIVNNNGEVLKGIKPVNDPMVEKLNYFDDKWHHFALVVERIGNTRLFVDNQLLAFEPSQNWSGFGGAKYFLGATGWYDINTAQFVKERNFSGKLDEYRVWNMARKQTQIETDVANRLRGDEFGLAAYLPFDNYTELMGVPNLTAAMTDVVSGNSTNAQRINGTVLQNLDVPTVKLQRPTSKVDYSFTATENEIIFTIKDPPARVENCILDITVKNVEDMYGNKMTSPITWSAFIDMNQMKWEQDKFEFQKKIYEPLEFTATIINSSGRQQAFSIGGLPSWLKASPMEGNLDPLGKQVIKFTVNQGINVGYYNVDLYLQTDFAFDEKLNLDLRVYKPMPVHWNVNPANYQHSMNIIAMLKINNVLSNDKYDQAGAFVDGECRGMVQMTYIEEYDMYEVFLTVYSNTETGEYFDIHVWDASEAVEYTVVTLSTSGATGKVVPFGAVPNQKKYAFTSNEIYGFPSEPLIIATKGTQMQVIPLNKGWNWVSFNLNFDNSIPLMMQLTGLEPTGNELVKTETQYTQFTHPIGWNGTLKALNYRDMFMFYMNQKDTLYIKGTTVDVESNSLTIHENWNRISYLPQVNMPIKEAFAAFHPNHGAVIKNQYSFAMFDRYMGWLGSLTYMRPNEGYMFYYKPTGGLPLTQNLVYPEKGSLSKGLLMNNEELIMNNEEWGTVYRANAMNMTILAEVQNMNIESDDILGVFAGENCVGYGKPVAMADGRKLFFIVANTYQNMAQLTFKLASGASSTLQGGGQITFNETTAFAANEMTGTLENPFILNANNSTTSASQQFNNLISNNVSIYPNPFASKTNFEIYLENQSDIHIEIFDITGRRVDAIQRSNVANGKHIVEWNGSRFANGIYNARVNIGIELFTVKIVKTE